MLQRWKQRAKVTVSWQGEAYFDGSCKVLHIAIKDIEYVYDSEEIKHSTKEKIKPAMIKNKNLFTAWVILLEGVREYETLLRALQIQGT